MTPHPDNDDRAHVRRPPRADSDGKPESPWLMQFFPCHEYDARGCRLDASPDALDSTGTPEPSPVWATPFDEANYFDHPTRS